MENLTLVLKDKTKQQKQAGQRVRGEEIKKKKIFIELLTYNFVLVLGVQLNELCVYIYVHTDIASLGNICY